MTPPSELMLLGCVSGENWPRSWTPESNGKRSLNPLLREAVRSRRVAQLTEARKRVAAAGISPMNLDEIQAEVEAYRTERRSPTSS